MPTFLGFYEDWKNRTRGRPSTVFGTSYPFSIAEGSSHSFWLRFLGDVVRGAKQRLFKYSINFKSIACKARSGAGSRPGAVVWSEEHSHTQTHVCKFRGVSPADDGWGAEPAELPKCSDGTLIAFIILCIPRIFCSHKFSNETHRHHHTYLVGRLFCYPGC